MTEKGGQFRKEEILNNINELLEAFEKNSTNNERTMLMMNLITRLMGGEAFMKQMCESMCSGMFSQGTTSGGQQKDSTCCTEHKGLISESGEKDVASKEITCCSSQNIDSSKLDDNSSDYESIKIQKTRNICPMCEDYAKAQVTKPVVIMSCEGACLRGEVSRQAANIVCHSLLPETTVRLCLGGAFTKDGGQRNLVRNAQKVVA
ncbi:MAG: putative zinc-binding protein, partial [Clostridiales bacterium]